jgi:hypothetical protein
MRPRWVVRAESPPTETRHYAFSHWLYETRDPRVFVGKRPKVAGLTPFRREAKRFRTQKEAECWAVGVRLSNDWLRNRTLHVETVT